MINVVQTRSRFVSNVVVALLLIGGVLHSRAEAAEVLERPHTYALSDVVISLERTGCLGSCPSYTVAIHGDGRVVYDGRSHVAVIGHREKNIDQKQVVELLEHIYKIRFFLMPNT
jgi:hypothetical protein